MTTYSLLSDQELRTKLVFGDEYAFAEFYERYSAGILGFVKKFVHSADLSEDLTQEIFIKIWQCRSKLADVQSLKAYLYIVARNHTLNSLKKAFRSEVAMSEVVNSFVEERNCTEDELLSKEYYDYLHNALAQLSPRSREIFKLCREQGKSYDEVATALGISRNAVKNHMVASMKILRTAVEKDLGISLGVILVMLLK
ncbi:RNA polymerase sigma-70 factor [Pedobacter ginsengisoli]|uniref:RNA polymerase sigma-70 factor n=1 Tax=Pedobacter ginsengisoli TaxID=363852 RepID=A0A2D1UBP6_9SPHI|nr:RNA polymerase sigma-70 factor [Pedobacter ginsengisoli]ATP59048.1 RNA polymerase sigma-70 factor [Pedobacter ginsengisoli]